MSKRERRAKPNKARGASSLQRSAWWLVAGLLLAALAFAPQVLALGALMLPTLLSAVFETAPGRPATRSVALCGLAAIWPQLELLWRVGPDHLDAAAAGLELRSLAAAWSAQAAGWLLAEALALLMIRLTNRRVAAAKARLEDRRARLLAEWRDEVAS